MRTLKEKAVRQMLSFARDEEQRAWGHQIMGRRSGLHHYWQSVIRGLWDMERNDYQVDEYIDAMVILDVIKESEGLADLWKTAFAKELADSAVEITTTSDALKNGI